MADHGNHDHQEDLEAEGIPDLETPVNEDEGIIPPRDYPQGATEFGVTAREERMGESLAQRVGREEPDVLPRDDAPVGRLVAPDGGMIDVDDEPTEVATDTGEDAGLSAEEAAMHITDTP
jgi:hypothetical protein